MGAYLWESAMSVMGRDGRAGATGSGCAVCELQERQRLSAERDGGKGLLTLWELWDWSTCGECSFCTTLLSGLQGVLEMVHGTMGISVTLVQAISEGLFDRDDFGEWGVVVPRWYLDTDCQSHCQGMHSALQETAPRAAHGWPSMGLAMGGGWGHTFNSWARAEA